MEVKLYQRNIVGFNFSDHRINKSTFGLAAGVAFMGAPVVVGEKLCSGNESKKCLNVIQNILATGNNHY